MSGYLIAFISAVVLNIALIIVTRYMENCHGKRYEATSGISEILQAAVMLTFGWWLLERFFSGVDSGFGWWILALAIGEAISIFIRIVTNRVCDKIWLKEELSEITTVKVRKGFKTAIDILTFVLSVGFIVFFIYGLFANKFDGIGEIIVAILVIVLFAFGSYDGMKKIIRQCKK